MTNVSGMKALGQRDTESADGEGGCLWGTAEMASTSSLVKGSVAYCGPGHAGVAANTGEEVCFPSRCLADVEHVLLCQLEGGEVHKKLRLKVYQPRGWELEKKCIYFKASERNGTVKTLLVQSSLSYIVLEATNEALDLRHGL